MLHSSVFDKCLMIEYCMVHVVAGVITSPTKGRLRFRHRRYVGRYIGAYVCEQLPGANSSDCHQTWSVIPLATGDEVIKFWKIKVQGRWGGYALYC